MSRLRSQGNQQQIAWRREKVLDLRQQGVQRQRDSQSTADFTSYNC